MPSCNAVDGRCSKDTLQELINHGADIDAKSNDGTTALLCACRTGQSESVLFLLEAGADVKIAKPDGNTSLHTAVYGNCNGEALQKIIQLGVNVNAINNNGQTALIRACYTAQAESVTVLLKNKADPNISDDEGYTSLHAAVYGNCTYDTLKEIIAHEAYLDAQKLDGQTALFLACLRKRHDMAKILLESTANPNIASTKGNTSLHGAVDGGCSKKIIKAIIKHGADVNATNKNSVTALMKACEKGNIDAINQLLNAKADPNIADTDGKTSIHYAVSGGCNKEALQAIINHGADVNATNKNSVTALMRACEKGYIDAINVLLNAGADPNIADIDGETWIHYAAHGGCNKEALQAIINHGADINATNKNRCNSINASL